MGFRGRVRGGVRGRVRGGVRGRGRGRTACMIACLREAAGATPNPAPDRTLPLTLTRT